MAWEGTRQSPENTAPLMEQEGPLRLEIVGEAFAQSTERMITLESLHPDSYVE